MNQRIDTKKLNRIKRRILWRRIGIVSWISFLFAALASVIFFAMFDPEHLSHVTTFPIDLSRVQGYSFGFLLFWLLTASCGTTVAWMMNLPIAKLRRPLPTLQDEE